MHSQLSWHYVQKILHSLYDLILLGTMETMSISLFVSCSMLLRQAWIFMDRYFCAGIHAQILKKSLHHIFFTSISDHCTHFLKEQSALPQKARQARFTFQPKKAHLQALENMEARQKTPNVTKNPTNFSQYVTSIPTNRSSCRKTT